MNQKEGLVIGHAAPRVTQFVRLLQAFTGQLGA